MSWVPPTKSQIRSWTFDALTSQADEWSRCAQKITEQRDVISHQLADSPGFWRRDAGDSMRWKGDEAKSSLSKVVTAFEDAKQITSTSFQRSAPPNPLQSAPFRPRKTLASPLTRRLGQLSRRCLRLVDDGERDPQSDSRPDGVDAHGESVRRRHQETSHRGS